jgi:hypothetical protein
MSITSVTEFVEEILRIRKELYPDDPYSEVWFRGVNDSSLDLLPGAYWRQNCDEQSLVLSFRSMAPAMLPQEPLDDWEWYFLMQHYGLPTRLLDWTENPLAALYFALEAARESATPCVWTLDPIALNRLSGTPTIVVPRDGLWMQDWLPELCGRGNTVRTHAAPKVGDNSMPLAIFPKRHNPRIVAQRGTFTVHGVNEIPINKLDLTDGSGGKSRISRIEISRDARDKIWDELWALGITRTAIYPEPQSLAEDLKRSYKTY